MIQKYDLKAWIVAGLSLATAFAGLLGFTIIDPSSRFRFWFLGLDGFASFVSLSALVVLLGLFLRHSRIPISWGWLLPPAALIFLFVGPQAVTSVAIQFIAAGLAGFALLSRVWGQKYSDKPSTEEALALLLLSQVSGLAVLSTLLWALSYLPINTAGSHALGYLIIALLSGISLRHCRLDLSSLKGLRSDDAADWRVSVLLAPGLVSALSLICMTALPELGSDARAAYSGMFEYLRFNMFWHHDPSLAAWGLQPLGGLYLAASNYLMGGMEAVRLQNAMMMVLGLSAASLIAGHVSGNRLGSAAAFSLAATVPLYLELTGEFYYDNTVAAFVVSAVLCLVLLARTDSSVRSTTFIVILALCLAGAGATKHTAWIVTIAFGVLAVLLILLKHDKPVRSILVLITSGIIAYLVLVLPIALAAYVQSGNPVFPYYNQVFQSPYYPPEQHSTPHNGYLSWDVFFRAVFDTNTFSSSDFRGGVGVSLLLTLPALIASLLSARHRSAMIICASAAALFVVLSAMQNDLRLLWPIILSLIALSAGLISAWIEDGRWTGRAILASFLAIAGLQLLLMPAGGHGVPGTNIADALSPRASETLSRQRAPVAAINAMLDGLPDRTERRLFLSTMMGPNAATSLEDGWYTFLARLRLHRSNSEDAMLGSLQALAPDAIILGSRGHRRWLNASVYPLLNEHALNIIDYPNHQVFLMDNTIAYPVNPQTPEDTRALLDQMESDGSLSGSDKLSFHFLTDNPSVERFRVQLTARCEVQDLLQIIVAVRAPGKLHEYTLTQRPCQGSDMSFIATASAFLPVGSTRVSVEIKTQSGDSLFSVSELEAGFKTRFDQNAALEL